MRVDFFPINSQYSSCIHTPGPLAQSAERRADNAKVVSSSLTWTTEFFVPIPFLQENVPQPSERLVLSILLSLAFSF